MQLRVYREFEPCGDEYMKDESDCPIELVMQYGDLHLRYHSGESDMRILTNPIIVETEKITTLTYGVGFDEECFHVPTMVVKSVLGVS